MKRQIIATNTLTHDTYVVSDDIKPCLLEINSKYKYFHEREDHTLLFIAVDYDDKDGHTYLIEGKLYETLYTNPISELEEMLSDITEIQLSLF